MQETILSKLHEIEQEKHVRILLAVESGSRAWGFASPDSDYDVRFIYAREPQDYLRLKKTRDVIEYPINDLLDINGWDLDKTFKLMHNGNPTIGEWLQSPIVYKETHSADLLRQAYAMCFSEKKSIYHYLNTAVRHYHEQVEDHVQVKAKKYFYILRPLLCARYILRERKQPPMLFSELYETDLPEALKPSVDRLLEIKRNHPELKLIDPVEDINRYILASFEELRAILRDMPDNRKNMWAELDKLFLKEIGMG